MNKYMNLIGIKARKASGNKIITKTKNKVLKDYAKLLDKEKNFILKENNNLVHRINVNNFSVTTDLDTQDDWNTFLKSNNDKVYFDN